VIKVQRRWRARHPKPKLTEPSLLGLAGSALLGGAAAAAAAVGLSSGGKTVPPPPPPRRSLEEKERRAREAVEAKAKAARAGEAAMARSSPASAAPEMMIHSSPRPAGPSLLDLEVRAQAAVYIDTTLSRELLIKHLKMDLAAMMEKGRVYQPRGARSQLVAWRVRYFFCSDHGLCYQKVSSQMRPVGEKRTIPWGAITKVEALLDDSIYLETLNLKKYYLKPKGVEDPAGAAWTWATRLCQLSQLLGNAVAGYVAMAAYGTLEREDSKPKREGGSRGGSAHGSGSVAGSHSDLGGAGFAASGAVMLSTSAKAYDDAFGFDDDGYGEPRLLTSRLPVPTGGAGTAEAEGVPVPYTNLAAISTDPHGPGGMWRGEAVHVPGASLPSVPQGDEAEGEEEEEGEETAEEAYRRRQWIIYYVSIGQFSEAEDIGWDGRSPPDPRLQLAPDMAPEASPVASSDAADRPTHTAPSAVPAVAAAQGGAPDAGIFYAKPSGEVVPAPAPASTRAPSRGKSSLTGKKRGGDETEPFLSDASAPAPTPSPLVARNSAIGWLQQRMSQIGRSPSTAGAPSSTPNRTPGPAEAERGNVTPLAMAPF